MHKNMAKKSKNSEPKLQTVVRSKALAYKNFNASKKKRRNRKTSKRYFEHDTRIIETHRPTKGGRTSASGGNTGPTAPIKKIKFNNEINIYASKYNTATTTTTTTTSTMLKSSVPASSSPLSSKHDTADTRDTPDPKQRKNLTDLSSTPSKRTAASKRRQKSNVAATTKQLQQQLLLAQKTIQKQLVALQQNQRAQSKSFLALIESKRCIHSTIGHQSSSDGTVARAIVSPIPAIANIPKSHSNHDQSEQFCKHFVDECNSCSNDIMANGNETMAIRAFACDPIANTCNASKCSSASSPSDHCYRHPYAECINALTTSCNTVDILVPERKKLAFHLKKPFVKSIIQSTSYPEITIKTEPEDIQDHTESSPFACDPTTANQSLWHPISAADQRDTHEGMQLAEMNKPNRGTHLKAIGMRSYSPPMSRSSKARSTVSSGSQRSRYDKRSNESRDRKSVKKKKRRRRSHSKSSHSRSRTRSHSRSRHRRQSHSHSRSQSRSRSKSTVRSRGYRRRRSSRSRSSSSHSSKRHGHDQKHSVKCGDDVRRSNHLTTTATKRGEGNCACACDCTNNCKRAPASTRGNDNGNGNSNSNRRTATATGSVVAATAAGAVAPSTLSPARHRNKHLNHNSINAEHSFNSKQHLTNYEASNRFSKKSFGTCDNGKSNGDGPGKRSLTLNSGVLLRQTPIVKLQCSPGTGSDSDNEIDERFDKKYEELLTFETNEDERREQRLLKALSDIAAKAKQKIQSISDPSNPRASHPDKNHNIDTTVRSMQRPALHNEPKNQNNKHDQERHSDGHSSEHDHSPNERRNAARRSRKDSSSSSSEEEQPTRSSSRSPSIPRRRGSPSFLDRRRITSARKKPIPYQRSSPYDSYDEWDSS